MCDSHGCSCSRNHGLSDTLNNKKGETIMHDLTYANQIIDRLKKEVANDDKAASMAVEVSLSPFSHVTPERLKDVFKLLAEDEGYTNTVLDITALEFCVHCKKCGKTWKSAKPTFKCPKCDSTDFDLEKWDEFFIDSVRAREVKGEQNG